jgi:O-methyltransferase involved in polyketide biosynthesis
MMNLRMFSRSAIHTYAWKEMNMNLSDVSKTGILTLISRVVASRKRPDIYKDPMAELCLENLEKLSSEKEKEWIVREKKVFSGTQINHAIQGARRSRIFDQAANDFIEKHPGCCVVNIACGFDTRFWRIASDGCKYLEVDFPEVVEVKIASLEGRIKYEIVSCSILDERWIEKVIEYGSHDILILAEGLFDYLSKAEIENLLGKLSNTISSSKIVFDILDEKYSKGIWKKLVSIETKHIWGIDISWQYGIKKPIEIEAMAKGLKLEKTEKRPGGVIISVLINAT